MATNDPRLTVDGTPISPWDASLADATVTIETQDRTIEQLQRRIELLSQPPLPGQHTTDEHLLQYTRPDSYVSPKYRVIIYKDGVRIPEREPVFIIRGQDATSAPFVRLWLQTNENTLPHDVVIQIRRIVWEMDRYEPKKVAD